VVPIVLALMNSYADCRMTNGVEPEPTPRMIAAIKLMTGAAKWPKTAKIVQQSYRFTDAAIEIANVVAPKDSGKIVAIHSVSNYLQISSATKCGPLPMLLNNMQHPLCSSL